MKRPTLKNFLKLAIGGLTCALVFWVLTFSTKPQHSEAPSSQVGNSQKIATDSQLPTSKKERGSKQSERLQHSEESRVNSSPLAQQKQPPSRKNQQPRTQAFSIAVRSPNSIPDPLTKLEATLEPRKPHQPGPMYIPPGDELRMTVKFMDWVMARSEESNHLKVSGASEEEINQLTSLAQEHGLEFNPTFDSPEKLDELRIKAARRSGQMQADLNGTMAIELPDPTQAREIALTLQSMAMVEIVEFESLDRPPPPPADIAPTTPQLDSLQGYLDTNPGFGVNTLKALGVNGEGIRFADCEYGYNPDHEDLVDSSITDESRAAINSTVYTNGWDEHGTAAIGITMAGDNGYGVTGIAPECDAYFYAEWTTLGYNRNNAVSDAVVDSSTGDVILLEMQQSSGNGSNAYVPAEYFSTLWNLTKTATDAGIIVVAAAGNGNQDLDGSYYVSYMNRGDSGAIIVGGGSNSTNHSKRSSSTYGSRVDVQAWGHSVATTGYGGYARYGGDDNQSYTTTFSGTSSASACTAGVVVLLQSYAKNKLDTYFTPEEMRSHLKTYGHPQGGSGGSIGNAIALDLAVPELPDRPLLLEIFKPDDDDISLSFWGLPFRTYQVQASENMLQWSDVITDIPGSAAEIEELLQDEQNDYSERFYRIQEQ